LIVGSRASVYGFVALGNPLINLIVGSRASVYGFVVLGFLPLRFSTESFV
jgi:hypothetical protein